MDSVMNAKTSLSDEEIIAGLQTFKPVDGSSEKNVWAFWDKGLAQCPAWCQRNIVSWVRRLGPSWTVRVLDMVDGSPVHYTNADLVRLPLLYLYGGIWMDVGFLLFRSLDNLCWDVLADPENPVEMMAFSITMGPDVGMVFNGCIAARKGCVCIKHWHNTFVEAWKGVDNTTGMSEGKLLRHLPRYEPPSPDGKMPPFRYSQFVDYIAQVFCLERVRHLQDPSQNWDGPAFFAEKVLLFNCVTEVYWAQRLTSWDGRKQFELLSCQRDGDGVSADDPAYKEADAFVSGILEMSSTMKISHGLVTAGREYLAELWDKPENSEADRAPGTFAAHLRWASVSFEQTRPVVPKKLPVRKEALLVGGMLEVEGAPRQDD